MEEEINGPNTEEVKLNNQEEQNIEEYKEQIKSWSDSFLAEQMRLNYDSAEICWQNAEGSFGKEREYWYDEYNNAGSQAKACKEELERRIGKTNGV